MTGSMYRRTFDPHAQDSLAKLSRWLKPGATVLELGPAAGYFTRHLREQGCTVDVVEIDPEAAAEVAAVARTVIVGDLAAATTLDELAGTRYDAIVCADVLEHVADGKALLTRLRALLAPQGELLLSVPNIAHSAVIAGLLDEHFDYGGEGLLDATHLHFYTHRSLGAVLADAGFCVEEWDSVILDAFATELRTRVERFRPELARFLFDRPNALVYQWLVRARPGEGAHGASAPVRQDVGHVSLRLLAADAIENLSLERTQSVELPLGAPAAEFEIAVTEPAGVLRIMLPDRAGVLDLARLELLAGDRVVWSMPADDHGYRTSNDVVRLDRTRWVLLGADTWIDPLPDPEAARSVDRIRLAAGWPTPLGHADAFAVFQALAEALVTMRRRLTLKLEELEEVIAARNVALEARRELARQLDETRAVESAERARLEAALAAQERIIAHRQSLSWWLKMPLLPIRSWWRRTADR